LFCLIFGNNRHTKLTSTKTLANFRKTNKKRPCKTAKPYSSVHSLASGTQARVGIQKYRPMTLSDTRRPTVKSVCNCKLSVHKFRIQDTFGPQTFKVFVVNGRCIYDLSIVRANLVLPRDRAALGVAEFILQRIEVLARGVPIRCTCRSQLVERGLGINTNQFVKAVFVVHNGPQYSVVHINRRSSSALSNFPAASIPS